MAARACRDKNGRPQAAPTGRKHLMKDNKISRTQLMALLWAGVMAPAAELLPALLLPGAGKGAWLAVVLAAPLVLAAGWLLGSLDRKSVV